MLGDGLKGVSCGDQGDSEEAIGAGDEECLGVLALKDAVQELVAMRARFSG